MIKKENGRSSNFKMSVGEPTIELSIIISLSCTSNALTLNAHSVLEWEILFGIDHRKIYTMGHYYGGWQNSSNITCPCSRK